MIATTRARGSEMASAAPTSSQAAAIAALRAWWRNAAAGSLAMLTGAPGSGISQTLRALRQALDDDTTRMRILATPAGRRTDADLLRAANLAFGGEASGRTGLELQATLRETLLAIAATGSRPLLAIDGGPLGGSHLEILRSVLTGSPASVILAGPTDLAMRIGRRPALQAALGATVTLEPRPDVASTRTPEAIAVQTRIALPGFETLTGARRHAGIREVRR